MKAKYTLMLLLVTGCCMGQEFSLGFRAAHPFAYAMQVKESHTNLPSPSGFNARHRFSAGVTVRYRPEKRSYAGFNFIFSGFSYNVSNVFTDTSYHFGMQDGLVFPVGFRMNYRKYTPGVEAGYRVAAFRKLISLFVTAKANFNVVEMTKRTSNTGTHNYQVGESKWRTVPEGAVGIQFLEKHPKLKGEIAAHLDIGYSLRSLQHVHYETTIPDRTGSNYYSWFMELTPGIHWWEIGVTYYLESNENKPLKKHGS